MKNSNKIIRLLAIVAVIQIALIIVTHINGNHLADHTVSANMLAFDKSQVNHLVIKDKDGSQVQLHKKDGKWFTQADFPANNSKVNDLLNKLLDLKHGIPIATSDSAQQRFKVSNSNFERLISLQHDDKKLATLYLGSGAGARQTHARSDSQSAVYTVTLGLYDASTKVEDWQNKKLLKLEASKISEVKLADLRLIPDKASQKANRTTIWKADNLPAGKMLNQKAINDSLNKLAGLSFGRVLGKQNKPEYGIDKPALSLDISYDGKTRKYQFAKLKDKEDYVLKVSDREEYFWIPSYTAKPLVDAITKEKWLMDEVKPDTATDKETVKSSQTTIETDHVATNKQAETTTTSAPSSSENSEN